MARPDCNPHSATGYVVEALIGSAGVALRAPWERDAMTISLRLVLTMSSLALGVGVPPGVFWTQDAAMRPPVLGRVRRTIRAWSAQGCDRHSSPAASARCSAQRRPGPRREPPRHCGKSGPTRPAP